jgi:tRNA1(Val) A37 N6-methylase TrmN6
VGEATTLDTFFGGRLHIRQPADGHRVGTDAMLLLALARSLSGQRVADFGAGAGVAGLGLAMLEPERKLTLVERDASIAALAHENSERNELLVNTRIVQADLTSAKAISAAGIDPASLDLVMMNPPFLIEGRARLSPVDYRRAAHAMTEDGLGNWIKAARRALVPGGWLALIHRADAVGDVLAHLATGFGAVSITPVHPVVAAPANRILVAARMQSKAPIEIRPALVLHDPDGAFTPLATAIHNGDARLYG